MKTHNTNQWPQRTGTKQHTQKHNMHNTTQCKKDKRERETERKRKRRERKESKKERDANTHTTRQQHVLAANRSRRKV